MQRLLDWQEEGLYAWRARHAPLQRQTSGLMFITYEATPLSGDAPKHLDKKQAMNLAAEQSSSSIDSLHH